MKLLRAEKLASKNVRFSQTDVSNFNRSISGITGHPLENQKNSVIYSSIGCWMQKSVWEYTVLER
jgi:hypothetical protein